MGDVRKILYIEHTAMAQSKTRLITDTIDFCALCFCSSAPINYTGLWVKKGQVQPLLPFKAITNRTLSHRKVTLNILCIFYSKHKKNYQTNWSDY